MRILNSPSLWAAFLDALALAMPLQPAPSLAAEPLSFRWAQLHPLPVGEGIAGTSAGVSHGALLVAGGAHFPDKMPWDGGRKVWHDTVFVLGQPNGRWTI